MSPGICAIVRSEWHRPFPATSTSTSPGPGSGTGTSTSSGGRPHATMRYATIVPLMAAHRAGVRPSPPVDGQTASRMAAATAGYGSGPVTSTSASPTTPTDADPSNESGTGTDVVSLEAPFVHGVASFDPTAESVLLWTRAPGV